MSIKIYCPNCNQEYEVSEDDVGKVAECAKCPESFVIEFPNSNKQNADTTVSSTKVEDVKSQDQSVNTDTQEIKLDISDLKSEYNKKTKTSKTRIKDKEIDLTDSDSLKAMIQNISADIQGIKQDISDLKLQYSKRVVTSQVTAQTQGASATLTDVEYIKAQIENISSDTQEIKDNKKLERMLSEIGKEVKDANSTGIIDIFKNISFIAAIKKISTIEETVHYLSGKITKIEESANSLLRDKSNTSELSRKLDNLLSQVEQIKRESSKDNTSDINRNIKDLSNKISNIERMTSDIKNKR